MAEYIEREVFLKSKREQYCEDCDRRKNSKGKMVYDIGDAPCRACSIDDILVDVEDFPVADVVERKRGKWETVYLDQQYAGCRPSAIYCSNCHIVSAFKTPFCPNCGADMRIYNAED